MIRTSANERSSSPSLMDKWSAISGSDRAGASSVPAWLAPLAVDLPVEIARQIAGLPSSSAELTAVIEQVALPAEADDVRQAVRSWLVGALQADEFEGRTTALRPVLDLLEAIDLRVNELEDELYYASIVRSADEMMADIGDREALARLGGSRLDRQWQSLSEREHNAWRTDLERTVVWWGLARDAIFHPRRPSVYSTIRTGHICAFSDGQRYARSGIHNNVRDLKNRWIERGAAAEPVRAWVADRLRGLFAEDAVLEALDGLVNQPEWGGRRGPAGTATSNLDTVAFECECCGVVIPADGPTDGVEPDVQQSSAYAQQLVAASGAEPGSRKFEFANGFVDALHKALPQRSGSRLFVPEYQRFMCGTIRGTGRPCWLHGGLLRPISREEIRRRRGVRQ